MRAILTFHGIDETGSVLSFAPAALRSLIASVRASGHEIVPLRALIADDAPRRVALTFDDGLAGVASEALPILRELGAPATLFLTTGHVGGQNDWPGQAAWAPRLAMLSWDQVDALVASGWDIQSHTVRHVDLRSLDDAALEDELAAANDVIERRVGSRPDCLAFPYGYFDARVLKIARAQNPHCFTTELAPLDKGQNAAERGYPRLDAYYLQAEPVQRHFGSAAFLAYMRLRAFARRMRAT